MHIQLMCLLTPKLNHSVYNGNKSSQPPLLHSIVLISLIVLITRNLTFYGFGDLENTQLFLSDPRNLLVAAR